MLIGDEAIDRLANASVAVFGIGGVGSYVAEALCRAGIGKLTFIDNDTVSVSNINRQLIALHSTVGRNKVDVMRERGLDINPRAMISTAPVFVSPETIDMFAFSQFSYVVDAVDNVTAKLLIIERCSACGTPVISSMGTGNKLSPEKLTVADIYDTSGCPLARVMRRELRKRGVERLKVVYSTEEPRKVISEADDAGDRRGTPGSMPFVPSAAGLLLASEVIRDIAGVR